MNTPSSQVAMMDVDSPTSTTPGSQIISNTINDSSGGNVSSINAGPSGSASTLKRCSSAPMINETSNIMTATNTPIMTNNREQQPLNIWTQTNRTRRFSASFSPLHGCPSPGPRLAPRINQIRQEEHADISNTREMAHERELYRTIQMSQSCEDLSLMGESQNDKPNKMGLLHVSCNNSPTHSSSPSRLSSPGGFQSPPRSCRGLFVRRSASPVLRPSPLGVKRKLDDDKGDFYCYPRGVKRATYAPYGANDLLTTTTSNSLPGGSSSSVGTPESLSSADSPSFNFRSVDSPSPGRVAMAAEPMIVSRGDQDMSPS